ncbi:hypothetical protein UlMin_017028 [Ulmus minor]
MDYKYNKQLSLILMFLFHVLCLFIVISKAKADQRPQNNKASAVFVFGDSTVDPGNNNYVSTIFKSNFLPYGRDFPDHQPTGRFSNGRLTTDYIASYVGVKEYVPPYLDPNLKSEDLLTGVSFASAGSGFDPLTPIFSNVIPVLQQLEYFKEYKKRVERVIGKQKTEEHIKKAIFFISAGTNDFVVNYFTIPIRRNSYSVSTYQLFLIQHVKQFLQGLWAEGARRIGMAGLPSMGCLPVVITLNSTNSFRQRGCIEKYNSISRNYNQILQKELHLMQNSFSTLGARISYIDIYGPLVEMSHKRKKFGFDEIYYGCCGTGYLEASFLCNSLTNACPDANKYMFWDSIHPSERTYYYIFLYSRPIIDFLCKG